MIEHEDAVVLIGVLSHIETMLRMGDEWDPSALTSRLAKDLAASGAVRSTDTDSLASAVYALNLRLRRAIGEAPDATRPDTPRDQ